MRDLGTLPGGDYSRAYDINGSGQVVGESNWHAVLWNGSGITDLGMLPDDSYSYAYGINDLGQVVGQSSSGGFLWENGTMTPLGDIRPVAINDSGQVVGSTWVRSGEGYIKHASTYEGGQVRNLNDLIDPASGWSLNDATDINDDGQIVGTGTIDGENHAFLLTPNPDAADTTPPKLSLPGDIAQEAASADGAEVTFTATATDEEPKEPAVDCSPASGSTFPLGETAVRCSATDAAGNRAEDGFKVTVGDTTAPDTAVESGPDGPTNDNNPTFVFGGSDAVSADLLFSYKVDDGAWSGYSTENSATLGG